LRDERLSVYDAKKQSKNSSSESSSSSSSALSPEEMRLQSLMDKLSVQQSDIQNCVSYYGRKGSKAGQLLMIIAGAAGVGKSLLLSCIALFFRIQYGSKAVEVVAPTNLAARLVDGHTLDSMLPPLPTGADDASAKNARTLTHLFVRAWFTHRRLSSKSAAL